MKGSSGGKTGQDSGVQVVSVKGVTVPDPQASRRGTEHQGLHHPRADPFGGAAGHPGGWPRLS